MLCVNSCGIDVYVKDGRVMQVEGMKEHPLNKGLLCPRGRRIVDWEYSSERLLHPMMRKGGAWQAISWDEALDTIATKLQNLARAEGRRALAIQVGSMGAEERESSTLSKHFAAAYGTPNYLGPGI